MPDLHLRAAGWSGRDRPDIQTVEAALEAAGIPFRRWCDLENPRGDWYLEVDGAVVARGGAIGVLEAAVWRWLREK